MLVIIIVASMMMNFVDFNNMFIIIIYLPFLNFYTNILTFQTILSNFKERKSCTSIVL